MDCRELRKRLTAGEALESAEHLRRCAACARYAERLQVARGALRERRGEFAPDAGFARRVTDRLPQGATETLGWAAARLLPVTLVLVLVLGWLALRSAPDFSDYESASSTDDPLIWVLEQNGDAG